MTEDEMARRFADENNISFEEAYTELFPNQYEIQPLAANQLSNTTREVDVVLNVTSEYHPYIAFFCYTSESGQYCGIQSIYYVTLVRSYNGRPKIFTGDVQAWLRSSYQIEFLINGDFYNTSISTTGGSISGSFGINQQISLQLGASGTNSSNYYKYYYEHGTASFQN
ncbi:MAG: hypothetical protein LKF53_05390 [Solobacterium sp.]|nr:hypothetical protein [Solobacterium sp.]MCH4227448.1 hypothetical protein [Solobacterium sp.]MCH4282872.1 hypothetical protein [Solobacterium sp.]